MHPRRRRRGYAARTSAVISSVHRVSVPVGDDNAKLLIHSVASRTPTDSSNRVVVLGVPVLLTSGYATVKTAASQASSLTFTYYWFLRSQADAERVLSLRLEQEGSPTCDTRDSTKTISNRMPK